MMRTALLASVLLAVVGTTGCGGGGGSSAPGSGAGTGQGTAQTLTIGNFTTRVSGTTQQPISVAGYGATVLGVAGGTVSSLTLTNPTPSLTNIAQTLAQTRVSFNRGSQMYQIGAAGGSAQPMTLLPTGAMQEGGSWSPDGTRAVFSQYDYTVQRTQIFGVNLNGTGLTRLSDGLTNDIEPAWSPSGQKIAFVRYNTSSGAAQIFTMNSNGSGAVHLTDGTTNTYSPSWSPGSDKLVFVQPSGSYYQLYIMNADGSAPHAVTTMYLGNSLQHPAWSPDGAKIACTIQNSTGSQILMLRADGLNGIVFGSTSITDFYPAWSPDGSKVAFTRYDSSIGRNQIWVMNEDGTAAHSIDDGTIDDYYPSWSPYVRFRRLVGAGALATTAAGFLAGQQGKIVDSVVLFSATTPNTAFLSTPATLVAGQSSLAITITADLLTSLVFTNNFETPATTVLGGATTATGASVTFDANDGTVSAVLPFNANKSAGHGSSSERKGDELILRHAFTGVWTGKGKNVAPGGASEVHVNARTGQLISYH